MPFVAFPRINESAEELLEMRRAERDERRRERLHLLWLIASGTVKSRADLARALARNRETLSRWLACYAQEGLQALLQPPRQPGPASQGGISLPAEIQEAVRVRLAQSAGEHNYFSLWRWAQAEHRVTIGRSHFSRWVHDRLGARLKVARKSHGEKKTGSLPPSATAA